MQHHHAVVYTAALPPLSNSAESREIPVSYAQPTFTMLWPAMTGPPIPSQAGGSQEATHHKEPLSSREGLPIKTPPSIPLPP